MALVECGGCGHENRDDATFCGKCGSPLGQGVTCAGCGRENPADLNFCDGCGQALASAAAAAPPAATEATSTTAAPAAFANGRYRVERFLGEGSRKRVYLAHDTRLDRDVALALVKAEGLDEQGRERLQRETQAMGRLGDHPHIVTVFDIDEDGDQLFIVSEFMAGGDLAGLLERAESGKLAIPEALRLAQEIAGALACAHDQHIVHRDVKPGNVWLTPQLTARLGDFGLAVALDQSRITREGLLVGTACYMSPEQAVGGLVDGRSDLYALGCVLYEMVAGRPPFLGDDALGVISQHLNTAPVAPSWHSPEVWPGLDEFIMSLLSKAADERPQTAHAVQARLVELATAATGGGSDVAPAGEQVGAARTMWGRYVGRSAELATLKAGVDDALSGNPGVIMLVGDPGIGKTRTAEEVATYAKMRGAQVLVGRCYEGEGAPAYWPWVQIIRDYVHDTDAERLQSDMGSGAGTIAQIVSAVREQLPHVVQPTPLEADEERFRLFDSITAFLRAAAKRRALILVLDDLHWADASSLLLLQFLARGLRRARLLVVATYRDMELDRTHPLSKVLAELRREGLYERVQLRGLSADEVTALVEAVAQQEGGPEGRRLAQMLHRETEGNPFFVEETLLHLLDSGAISRSAGGRWTIHARSIEELGIPEGVREVVGRRLSRLSKECNRVLAHAAVVGRDFDTPVLAAISECSSEDFMNALEEAKRAEVIREASNVLGRFRFAHALIRETLYDELSAPQRVRLHRQVGEVLERLHASNPEPVVAALAYHFTQGAQAGGDVDKAIAYAVRAGERATAQVAYDDAVLHYERALQAQELQDPIDESLRCDLLLALGPALANAGHPRQANDMFLQAIDLARRLDTPKRFAQAAVQFGLIRWAVGRVDEQVRDLAEEGLVLLPDEDSAERAMLLALLPWWLVSVPYQRDRRLALCEEALAMARRVGSTSAILAALDSRLVLLHGTPEEELALAREIIQLGEAENWSHWVGLGWLYCAGRHTQLGDMAAVADDLAALQRLAAQTHRPVLEWYAHMVQTLQAILAGRLEEAEQVGFAALEHGRRYRTVNAIQIYSGQLGILRWLQGRMAEVDGALQLHMERFPDEPVGGALLVLMYTAVGREADARAHLDVCAAHDFADLPQDTISYLGYAMFAEAVVDLQDRPRAALLYDLLLPYADRAVVFGWAVVSVGAVAHWLGTIAALLERWDAAAAHFEAALELNARLKAAPFLARTQQAYAQLLWGRADADDRHRAVDLTNAALQTATAVGMKVLVRQALDLKLRMQGVDTTHLSASICGMVATAHEQQLSFGNEGAGAGTVTLIFSDMKGLTGATASATDSAVRDLMAQHAAIVREQLLRYGGREVRVEGGGFLLAFADPARAVHCALGIRQAFDDRNAGRRHSGVTSSGEPVVRPGAGTPPAQMLHVRMGLHTDDTWSAADSCLAKSVVLASRIAAQAETDEILVSAATKTATAGTNGFSYGEGRPAALDGIEGAFELHPVVRRSSDA